MYPRPPVPEGLDQGYLAFQAMHLPPREKGVRDTWSKINVNLSTIKSLFKRTFRSTHPTWTCHPHPLGHTPRSEPDGIDFASATGLFGFQSTPHTRDFQTKVEKDVSLALVPPRSVITPRLSPRRRRNQSPSSLRPICWVCTQGPFCAYTCSLAKIRQRRSRILGNPRICVGG